MFTYLFSQIKQGSALLGRSLSQARALKPRGSQTFLSDHTYKKLSPHAMVTTLESTKNMSHIFCSSWLPWAAQSSQEWPGKRLGRWVVASQGQ
jgi:hypothetical protein